MSPLPVPLPAIPPNVALPLIRHRLTGIRRLNMSFVDSALIAALIDLTGVVEHLSAALDEVTDK